MAEDWALNVRKYAPQADPDIIAGIIRHCGIALQSRDASLVSFTDKAETDRVRESFLKKKLGVMEADEQLDNSITAVGEKMKGESFRHRVTVYYLLADHYGKLEVFRKSSAHAGDVHANGSHGAEPPAAQARHVSETSRATEAPHIAEVPRPAEAPDAPATHSAEPLAAAAYKSADPGDTARSGAASLGSFGAAGAAAGVAGVGAGGAAIKGTLGAGGGHGYGAPTSSAGGSAEGSAAQAFVGSSAVEEPATRSGGIHWLLWLILAIAVVLLVLYLLGYRL